MHRIRLFAAVWGAAVLSGCIVVADPDGWDGGDYDASWERRQEVNRDYIAELRIGRTVAEVRNHLGRADYSEAYSDDAGREVLILRYRTHHERSDGDTTRDETTPLVFVNGELVGWGEEALRRSPERIGS